MLRRRMTPVGIILVFVFLQWTSCTEIIPERVHVEYYNKKYFANLSMHIKRYARRSPYYLNMDGTVTKTLDDNITFHGVFHEYLHNEYRRSFVELHVTMCDLVHKNPWKDLVGAAILSRGGICPATPATYKFHNLTISIENLPYVWPFEKGLLSAYAQHQPSKDIVARGNFYFIFKSTLTKKI